MSFFNRLRVASQVLRTGSLPSSGSVVVRREPWPVSSENGVLSGKNVLITGVGPNIGKSLTLEMGRQGAKIYFTDLNRVGIADIEEECQNQQISCKGFVFDIRKVEDTDALCTFFDQNAISIDVMVHNAALEFKNTISLMDFNLDDWVQTYTTNVFGPMYLTKCIVERMRRQGNPASIIFITSIQQFTLSGRISYSSSKAALGMIVKELAVELAAYRIRVNGIAPGPVKVDSEGKPKPHRFVPLYKTSIPPEFVGRASVYLASDYYSYYTTGTVVTVDGGVSLYNYHSPELSQKRNKP